MSEMRGQQATQTLGQRLLSLGPGDQCPCCGSRLRAFPVAGSRRAETCGGDATRPTGLLVCPRCGCEIDDQEAPTESDARVALSIAA